MRMVLEEYRRVRTNQGAAGIDGESIEMFEANLSRNLYKLWNRMASGNYFPPAVKQVEIAKKSGNGKRVLGIQLGRIAWHRWLSSKPLSQYSTRISARFL